nr:kelch-like protein 3 [Ipomoea batatas]
MAECVIFCLHRVIGRMGSKKKKAGRHVNKAAPNFSAPGRNLSKSDLGAVIFGCKHYTIQECFSKMLFGLPHLHSPYVKKVSPGLPLFLFNYSDRKLHGIFKAVGHGQLNIDPHAWTGGSVELTEYPAQVQFKIYKRCHALTEDQFSPIIADNYYETKLFWFELDQFQTAKLIALFSPSSVPNDGLHSRNIPRTTSEASTSLGKSNAQVPFEQNRWSALLSDDSTSDMVNKDGNLKLVSSHPNSPLSKQSSEEWKSPTSHLINKSGELDKVCAEEWAEAITSLPQSNAHVPFEQKAWSSLFKDNSTSDMVNKFEHLKIVSSHPTTPMSKQSNEEWKSQTSHLINKSGELYKARAEERAELMQVVETLMDRQRKQEEKIWTLEKELVQSRDEYKKLQNWCNILQAGLGPSSQQFEGVDCEPLNCNLKTDDYALVVGGFDGYALLHEMSSYSPLHDRMESLSPMTFQRTCHSVANLNGEVYVLGGVYGDETYDTVESYNPKTNQWCQRPSLNHKKQSLAGASLYNKIFAVGGGNGVEYFSEVEMLDLNIGKWIHSGSMLEKRVATAAVEINGALYVVGGMDGQDYLKSAERFDPREHAWRRLANMKTKRAYHSLVAYNEKLYTLGGYDGERMVQSVEVFDPRVGSWMMGEQMKDSRGHFGAVVIGGKIYAIGGINNSEEILATVECYEDGCGWQLTNLRGFGKRCDFSAIVL